MVASGLLALFVFFLKNSLSVRSIWWSDIVKFVGLYMKWILGTRQTHSLPAENRLLQALIIAAPTVRRTFKCKQSKGCCGGSKLENIPNAFILFKR